MARPRVFISSTFYDLKHVRASIDLFIRSLGFDSILSEKGDIAYSFDRPLDDSCYVEVSSADIFVMIIGGRYGAAASDQPVPDSNRNFYDRYESITKKEYERAADNDIPIYVLIEKAVYAEYQTFRANRENDNVRYAHVDSANVFHLIEEILSQPRNNPMQTFERFTDIEDWLREQWAGLFRDLLKRVSQQQQLRAMSEQISEMAQLNETLKTYMEAVVTNVAPNQASSLISEETKRLSDSRRFRQAVDHRVVSFLDEYTDASRAEIVDDIVNAKSSSDLRKRLLAFQPDDHLKDNLDNMLQYSQGDFLRDLNEVRAIFDKPPLRKLRQSTTSTST